MVVPSTGSDIWIMDPCSGDVSGGTLGNNPLDDEFAGSFRINGTGTLAVKFTATIGANFSGVDAPVLSVITTCPATSPQDLTGGVLVVGVGATLTVATSTAASATPYTATINVSANY
ncbi:MAG: hypothetical protein IH914_04825 [candidate division Zixibacteria bacterium]|nr:hypothetical protein [candidate division Zixibacteria bacterium]